MTMPVRDGVRVTPESIAAVKASIRASVRLHALRDEYAPVAEAVFERLVNPPEDPRLAVVRAEYADEAEAVFARLRRRVFVALVARGRHDDAARLAVAQ